MEVLTYPTGTTLYKIGEVPSGVYYLLDGKIEVMLQRKTGTFEYGTFGEWSLFNLPSEETVTTVGETTLYFIKPSEIGTLEIPKLLITMVSSIAKRLLIVDSELSCCSEIPEYLGPDKLRYFNRVHPNSFRITDGVFQDMFQIKRLYTSGYYKEAFEIAVKLLSQPFPEELKKEIMVWYTLLNILLEPEKAEMHFSRLAQKDYAEHISYAYLYTFFKGGQKQEVLDMFMKAGLYLPKDTIVTLEGDAANEGYFLIKGYLKAVKLYEDREVLLSIVQPGEFVGESALLDAQPRMVTLYTMSPAAIIPMSSQNIEKAVERNPNFVLRICESQLKRISQVKSLIRLKNITNDEQRAIATLRYFEPLLTKVRLTCKDISSLVDVSIERVVDEAKRLGYKIAFDGTITV
ncbi:MAG TPA: cyclic nucleotide-binding domain-containing protein [Fervidobacterium sp.]|nr:cyclic nucleotide-binding domain-containing protein [Fervidobacterium sp.]HPC78654.1 cyclic nucleotide-binding domain-containing protein [Fervidobacterium sp.]HRV37526.1 cyclic nucleotide-binding domain-containing protein [Fervidobacterium sp.]